MYNETKESINYTALVFSYYLTSSVEFCSIMWCMQIRFVAPSVGLDAVNLDMKTAWNFAYFAARSAIVFHQGLMATNMNVLATETWGILRALQSALKYDYYRNLTN